MNFFLCFGNFDWIFVFNKLKSTDVKFLEFRQEIDYLYN